MFSGNVFSGAPFSALPAGGSEAAISGISLNLSIGSVVVEIPLTQSVTGEQISFSLGTASAVATVAENVTGMAISASQGSVILEIPATLIVTGEQIQFFLGEVSIPINGVSMQFQTGLVAAYAWIDVPDAASSWSEIPDQSSTWVPVSTAPNPNWIEV